MTRRYTHLSKTIRRQETRFVFGSIVVLLLLAYLSSRFSLGWRAAAVTAGGMYAAMTAFALITRDGFFKLLLLFGLAAGTVELAADWWLVEGSRTLDYPQDEYIVGRSPLYMPFAWAVVLTQVGYLGWLISRREKLVETVLITFLIGATMIPIYEHLANHAMWWRYKSCKMILDTPYFIILGEGMICAMLPVIYKLLGKRRHATHWLLGGAALGLWIWASYGLAYVLFE